MGMGRTVRTLGLGLVMAAGATALAAAYLKGSHRMSYVDCLAVALAERLGATIVTGDPDFSQVEDIVAIEWLASPSRE